jgi:hypothetical protein
MAVTSGSHPACLGVEWSGRQRLCTSRLELRGRHVDAADAGQQPCTRGASATAVQRGAQFLVQHAARARAVVAVEHDHVGHAGQRGAQRRTGSGRNSRSLTSPTASPAARSASTASRAVPHMLPSVTSTVSAPSQR